MARKKESPLIIYSPNPISMLKAALLSGIQNKPYACRESQQAGSLFTQEELNADSYNLAELAEQYTHLTGRDLAWLQNKKVRHLYARLSYGLRHSSLDKFRICQAALEDALAYGLEYFLANVSSSCRRFTDLAREVSHEVQRMLGYIRFTSPNEETLVAKPKLFHDTADLILKKFQARYPHYRIILILEDKALALEKGSITTLTREQADTLLPREDPYTEIWQGYYKSQYIEGRKNITLASKAIPQKYWDWMPEGRILQEEKNKLR